MTKHERWENHNLQFYCLELFPSTNTVLLNGYEPNGRQMWPQNVARLITNFIGMSPWI